MAEAKKRNWETPQILSDLPLRESDTAHFHFDEFAATLARLIADPLRSRRVSGPRAVCKFKGYVTLRCTWKIQRSETALEQEGF